MFMLYIKQILSFLNLISRSYEGLEENFEMLNIVKMKIPAHITQILQELEQDSSSPNSHSLILSQTSPATWNSNAHHHHKVLGLYF